MSHSAADLAILLADDEPFARAMLVKMLEALGFTQVVPCANGAVAWTAIETALRQDSPFDLVISDWRMPEIDGVKLLTRIRRHERTNDLPFILLTGLHEADQVSEAIALGVTDYIVKPPSIDTLKTKLERILQIALVPAKKAAGAP
jgi:two-component system chemotaxis response regulator CheY